MALTRTLYGAPGSAGIPVVGLSGTVYTPDAAGMIENVSAADIGPLIAAGFIVGIEPTGMLTQFGGSALFAANGAFGEEGNIYRNVGNPIAGNAADTTDDILGGILLPAGAFDIAGRGLCITAQGKTGATTNNKRFKLFLNPTMAGQTVTNGVISGGTVSAGTAYGDSGTWVNGTTPNNAVGWGLTLNLFKYGAAGANTQYVQASPILGATHGGISPPVFLTLPENAVINIVITGSSYTTGAANDVILNMFEVNAMN